MPRPLRSACDRCHSMRLKCPKEAGSVTCMRCAKAGLECAYSPAGPAQRRALASPPYNDELSSLGMPMAPLYDFDSLQFEWPSVDSRSISDSSLQQQQQSQPQQSSVADSPETPVSNSKPAEDPRTACVEKLSSLAHEIDRFILTIPEDATVHVSREQPLNEVRAAYTRRFLQEKCVEMLFTFGQRLGEAYPLALRHLVKTHSEVDCNDPGCMHRIAIPQEVQDMLPFPLRPVAIIDSFLFSTLCACHMRYLDAMEAISSHASLCARTAMVSPEMKDSELNIPELRVGDFKASAQASTTLQSMLLLHFAALLLDRAESLKKTVFGALEGPGQDPESEILKLRCQLLTTRADSNHQGLQRLRDTVAKLGFLN